MSNPDDVQWRATCSADMLRARADLLKQVREYFSRAGILEVETPVLGRATSTEPNLASFTLTDAAATWYLQTSPEFAMKRLLAAGSGAIYQICKAFRQGESGPNHNQEFTILEWYRPGWNYFQLMLEVDSLMVQLLNVDPAIRISYRKLFEQHTGMNPHNASNESLVRFLAHQSFANIELGKISSSQVQRNLCLDLIMSHLIEPELQNPAMVYDFPMSQAALAAGEQDSSGDLIARRFEYYLGGRELANGYQELTDPLELKTRFHQDQSDRRELSMPAIHLDERLLAAMVAGLPQCAGVAVGLDRLLMQKTHTTSISDVISFPAERA